MLRNPFIPDQANRQLSGRTLIDIAIVLQTETCRFTHPNHNHNRFFTPQTQNCTSKTYPYCYVLVCVLGSNAIVSSHLGFWSIVLNPLQAHQLPHTHSCHSDLALFAQLSWGLSRTSSGSVSARVVEMLVLGGGVSVNSVSNKVHDIFKSSARVWEKFGLGATFLVMACGGMRRRLKTCFTVGGGC